MGLKLRELIITVRTCKTTAEERGAIQKECSAIRDSLKEGKESHRARNMLKLMYISMLGYSTEFAQMEVVKLLAKPDYGDKRVGYLTFCVLLDETAEVLTLAENIIKRDLSDKQPFTQALALATVANVAGEDMARDVMNEVVGLVDSSNTHLKKKACLAGLRIVRRVPDFAEVFLDKLTDITSERHHGALLSGLTLVNECLSTGMADEFFVTFRQAVPAAIRVLKGLVLSATSADTDVAGLADPFLQVKLLEFIRVVAKDSVATSEAVNDILAQVATNTDGAKNAGSSVLYECAKTIFAIHADDGLKVLGINILARFLTSTKDNNLRYVALSSLLQVYPRDPEAVQRHQATIIDCLKDVDLSIRRRALELTVALIDASSVRTLIPDLLVYLTVCGDEMRDQVTTSICDVIEKLAPTPEWRVEMSLRVFKSPRATIKDKFATNFIAHLTNQPESTKTQATQGMWEELSLPFDAQLAGRTAMLLAAVWTAGEYADLLTNANGGGLQFAEQIASCVYGVTNNTQSNLIKQYGLTALAKIVAKYPQTSPLVTSAFDMQATNLDCELQQRACEYATLVEAFADLAKESLAPIPAIVAPTEEAPQLEEVKTGPAVPAGGDDLFGPASNGGTTAAAKPTAPKNVIDDLFSDPAPVAAAPSRPAAASSSSALDDMFGGGGAAPAAAPQARPPQTNPTVDIFGGGAPAAPPPQPQPATSSIDSMFGAGPAPTLTPAPVVSSPPIQPPRPAAPVQQGPKKVKIHQGTDVSVFLMLTAPASPQRTECRAEVVSHGGNFSNMQFLVAVPKTTAVDIKPLASTSLSPSQPLLQDLSFNNTNDPNQGKTLHLKIRLMFKGSLGEDKMEQFQVSQEVASLA